MDEPTNHNVQQKELITTKHIVGFNVFKVQEQEKWIILFGAAVTYGKTIKKSKDRITI